MKAIRSCDNYTLGLRSLILSQHQMEKIFMTATSGADSGNDDEEEEGGLGVGLEAPVGFTVGQKIGMKPPTVEYFYFSDNQFYLHFRT